MFLFLSACAGGCASRGRVHLIMTSCDRQTNYQSVTGVNIHRIAFTRALAVLSTNFYCYHEHYHVGEKPFRATRSGIGLYMQYSLPPSTSQ